MDTMPPMRPVRSLDETSLRAPVWKVVAVWGVCFGFLVYGALERQEGLLGWICGGTVAVVGLGLYGASVARTVREHADRPVPWWRSAGSQLRRSDVLAGAGAPLSVAGAAIVGGAVDRTMWCVLAAGVVMAALSFGGFGVHNARLRMNQRPARTGT